MDDARELTFLPDLTELTPTKLDYGVENVVSWDYGEEQQAKSIAVLKKHEQILNRVGRRYRL